MTTALSLLPLPVSFWLWSERVQMPQRHPGLEQQQGGDQDPEPIKEDQVDPQVHPMGCVQVRTAEQPIGTERHPAAIQFAHAQSNLQEVPTIQNTT